MEFNCAFAGNIGDKAVLKDNELILTDGGFECNIRLNGMKPTSPTHESAYAHWTNEDGEVIVLKAMSGSRTKQPRLVINIYGGEYCLVVIPEDYGHERVIEEIKAAICKL